MSLVTIWSGRFLSEVDGRGIKSVWRGARRGWVVYSRRWSTKEKIDGARADHFSFLPSFPFFARSIHPGNPKLVDRVLDVQPETLCYIYGTIYMDMPLKPNVLEDISKDVSERAQSPSPSSASSSRADPLPLLFRTAMA